MSRRQPPKPISYDEWLFELNKAGATLDEDDSEFHTVYELCQEWGFPYTEASCHKVRNLLQRARLAGALEMIKSPRTAIDGTVRPQPVYRVNLTKLKEKSDTPST